MLTYSSWYSEFALYLATTDRSALSFGICQCGVTFDLKLNVDHSDIYFTVQ